jgi:tetratricopeptide (TPR) repeat protein
LDLIARWVAEGKLEGDPQDLPDAPFFDDGWQLGEPDLVISMEADFTLQAEGQDVYRNFIIPARTDKTKYVRAVEFRPDNRVVVHHCLLFVDRAGTARAAERLDGLPGYDGMGAGELKIPDGQFIGWVPGKLVLPGSEEIGWSVDQDTDLVVQVHMRPTGKLEKLNMSLGLYFNDGPPTKTPVSVRMASRDIDIPAGEANYLVETEYELPVDANFIGVYPHTHYLGKDILLTAVKPDGSRKTLLHIPDWDYNWQDEYRYVDSIPLPAGTRIEFKYTYDNSAENPLNPNHPPIRVQHGSQSSDEMAEVVFQMLTSEEDRPVLMQHYNRFELSYELDYRKRLAQADPDVPTQWNTAASYAMQLGLGEEAIELYSKVVEMTPGNPTPLYNLGRAHLVARQHQAALKCFNQVLAKQQGNTGALIDRARTQRALGQLGRAKQDLMRALSFAPSNTRAHVVLAELLLEQGDAKAALTEFKGVLRQSPEHTRALWNLGLIHLGQGDAERAEDFCRRAIHFRPEDSDAHLALGRVLQARKETKAAKQSYTTAQRLNTANETIQGLIDSL